MARSLHFILVLALLLATANAAPFAKICFKWLSGAKAALEWEAKKAERLNSATYSGINCMRRSALSNVGAAYGCLKPDGSNKKCNRCIPDLVVWAEVDLCKAREY